MTSGADSKEKTEFPLAGSAFLPTQWTVVMKAGAASEEGHRALNELCHRYWDPLHAFSTRRGYSREDAEDLVQTFFSKLLTKNPFGSLDRQKGRFRSFLLASFKHFLANDWDRSRAQKRGGNAHITHFDAHHPGSRYKIEPHDNETAERAYERQWAVTLLEHVLSRLESELSADGKGGLFAELKVFLTAGKGAVPQAEVAARLGMSEGAVKVATHRLRKRYRELLRDEIAQTVASPEEIEDEIRALFAAFS